MTSFDQNTFILITCITNTLVEAFGNHPNTEWMVFDIPTLLHYMNPKLLGTIKIGYFEVR